MKKFLSILIVSSLLFTTSISAIEIPVPEEKLESKTTIDEPKKVEINQEELLEWETKLNELDKKSAIYFEMMLLSLPLVGISPDAGIILCLSSAIPLFGKYIWSYRKVLKQGKEKGFKRKPVTSRDVKGNIIIQNRVVSYSFPNMTDIKTYIYDKHLTEIACYAYESLIEVQYGVTSNLLIGLQTGYIRYKNIIDNPYWADPITKYAMKLYPLDINATYYLPFSTKNYNFLLIGGINQCSGELVEEITDGTRTKYTNSSPSIGGNIGFKWQSKQSEVIIFNFGFSYRMSKINELKDANNNVLKLNNGENVTMDFSGMSGNMGFAVVF